MIDYIFGALVLAVLFLVVAVIGLYMAVSNINKDMRKIPLLKQRFIRWGEIYKTSVLTVWLGWSGYLMYEIYNNPILLKNTNDIWSNLIAVIGIIVATLIGWQIYSAMDWNSKAERLAKIENTNVSLVSDVKNVCSYAEASVLFIDALMTIADLGDEPNKKDGYQDNLKNTYTTLLKALTLYAGPTLEETIQNCLQYIEHVMDMINLYDVEMDNSFHEDCNELYEIIKSNKGRLTKAQWGSVQRIHKKRVETPEMD